MALAALGLTEAPVHEPVHDHHSEHLMSTTESYHAPRNIDLNGLPAGFGQGNGRPDPGILRLVPDGPVLVHPIRDGRPAVHRCMPKIAGLVVRAGRSCGLVSQTARR